MQNQNSNTARQGIPLDQKLFGKAITKAQDVRPRVVHVGAHYGVLQADQKSWAHVVFHVLDNRLFASCTCYAHVRGDRGKPVPCYHIAAAALSRGAAALIAPPINPEPRCPHAPNCAPGWCDADCDTASEMAEAAALHFEAERRHWEITMGYGHCDKAAWV